MRRQLVAEPGHVSLHGGHVLAEDVAVEGAGEQLPPAVPPRPRAGQQTLAQPRGQELVIITCMHQESGY